MTCSPCAVSLYGNDVFITLPLFFQSGGKHIETRHPDWDTKAWHFQRTASVRTVLKILANRAKELGKYATRRFRITGFLHFAHRPIFDKLENTTFRKQDLFLSSGEGKEIPTLFTERPVFEVSSF
jgi:hypothetical protein